MRKTETAWALALTLLAVAAAAEDRDLLRQGTGDPYVFILFDTSGSMHWTPQCTQQSFDLGECDLLCPTGDCYAPRNGDDPASKLYQAKAALHQVLQSVDNVHFGFATYNQDELRVRSKHWYYRVADTAPDGTANQGIALDSGARYPVAGGPEVFGRDWNCDNGSDSGLQARGCSPEYPADLDDEWELLRVQQLPKDCSDPSCGHHVYVRDGSKVYRVTYWQDDRDAWPYGGAVYRSRVKVERCDKKNCSKRTSRGEQHVYYDLVDEFLAWDNGARRGPERRGFFSQSEAGDPVATNTCDGWDGNDDTDSDKYPDAGGYNLRWPTDAGDPRDEPGGTAFDLGDVIPLDWDDDHQAEILARLAPAGGVPGGSFDVSPYFRDVARGTCSGAGSPCFKDSDCDGSATCGSREDFLRLKDEAKRPIIADGATPLGNAVRDFRAWYRGCARGNCRDDGWEDLAAVLDPDWACRKKYLLVITDGDDTCSGPDACSGTASLRAQTGVLTYVVAFGVQGGGNKLTCMASNGGTGAPIYPKNQQELVDVLNDIFNEIKAEARSFASASVPTVQNETSDKIYLSSFTPLPDAAVWPGRIDAFRKPLPLRDDDTPDFGRPCTSSRQAACHLWNAGEVLRGQAPTPADADLGNFKLGLGSGQRRVLYGREADPAVPTPLRLFRPPVTLGEAEYDLWRGLGIVPAATELGDLSTAEETAAAAATHRVIGNTLKIKTEIVPDPEGFGDQVFEYVLGDIFHADPLILSSPDHLRYFRQDLEGYRDFAHQHFWRRKMLALAANDGQLHFFDAGVREMVYDPVLEEPVPRFNDGTGIELFSYLPRLALPVVARQFGGSPVADPGVQGSHVYSLDGLLTTADVFIDPLHGGMPRAADRGWRSVVVGGLREGGEILGAGKVPRFVSGYFALDVTRPDRLFTPEPTPDDPDPRPYPIPVAGVVPSCLLLTSEGHQGVSTECPTPAGSPYAFPAELWSFTDRIAAPGSGRELLFFDEEDAAYPGDPTDPALPTPDGNGLHDLGDTWSKPVVGQILVCDPSSGGSCRPDIDPDSADRRFVAIFGGGLDPRDPGAGGRGSWLYMVDIETGRAIYKRQLLGSAVAGPAAIDRDRDGILDTIYATTTAGLLYKVDLTALTATGAVPALEEVVVGNDRLAGSPLAAGETLTVRRITDRAWDPFPIFDTGGRPIYMTPTAIYVPRLDAYALAFGTGNRHDLWQRDGVEGRFYTVVDEDYGRLDPRVPRLEDHYEAIDDDAPALGIDLLIDPTVGKNRGWVLRLAADDRVITQAFSLVSVLVFTTFQPFDADPFDDAGNAVDPCARTGKSRIFVVDATNADAFVDLDGLTDEVDRFLTVGDFTTSPYIDQTASKNPPSGGGKDTESVLDPRQAALQQAIREGLKQYFPASCRYNDAYSLTVNASRSDTGFVRYATIPIAMCPVDWKGR